MAINTFKLEQSHYPIFYALQLYYGLGPFTAKKLCIMFGVSPIALVSELPKSKIKKFYRYLDKRLILETERKVTADINIQNLMKIKSFRGVRLEKGQPVRGQSSRTNGGTQRRRPILKIIEEEEKNE
jgi:small subunit ribosomal protein S13